MFVNGKVKYVILLVNVNSLIIGEIRVNIIINGVENILYIIIKNLNEFSLVIIF